MRASPRSPSRVVGLSAFRGLGDHRPMTPAEIRKRTRLVPTVNRQGDITGSIAVLPLLGIVVVTPRGGRYVSAEGARQLAAYPLEAAEELERGA
jgi:hypothetical protein